MNILYATRAAIPYPSAACLNTVQMCQSLAELGHRVTLLVGRKPWRWQTWQRNWRSFFGFEPAFAVHRLWEIPKADLWFDHRMAQRADRDRSWVYLRYPRGLAALQSRQILTVLEIHSTLTESEMQLVLRSLEDGHLRGIVVISAALKASLLRDIRMAPFQDRILVAADAVDLRRFHPDIDRLPGQRVGYVGSLYPGKGMEIIEQIARQCPDLELQVYGGSGRLLHHWQRRTTDLPRLQLHGAVAPARVPACLQQFGVALLPNQPSVRLPNGDDIGAYTSPMKLFEYMAAGRVIIASDLPVLREVLTHERNCLLVPSDSSTAWVAAIRRIQSDHRLAGRLALQARQDAETRYSYEARFRTILNYFRLSAGLTKGMAA